MQRWQITFKRMPDHHLSFTGNYSFSLADRI